MAVFKCKMCGGTIEFEQGATVGVCDSCGTKQTLPKVDDRLANLYGRANHFRRNNEFDKASGIYEQILNENTSDAEAYWSLVLCRYGIEYVEDPATRKRIPTVNRAQFTSIFDDDNYKSALQYADSAQKVLYESEANAINEIQKGILAISQKEEPFDVFICYKETDAAGKRTQDSVLANDLYHQLTQEGFKVFFARITLEDKLGTAYEPYIFAALNSAKVMVVLGTKPEYFNAVWVKNEWSRYLNLVKASGGKKVLIPAYRDMDPYDLPDEFSHLQAQDMSKLGFMQDLIRGIKKITSAETPKTVVKETVVSNAANASIAPLLKRAFMFLEDGEWSRADDFCEQVLNQDPENAQAYIGKLMAELHVRRREDLQNCEKSFEGNSNYQKAIRFGDDKTAAELKGYIAHINERNETFRLTGIYNSAVYEMNSSKTEADYKAAAAKFKTIPGFKDANALVEQCFDKAEVCRKDAVYAFGKAQMTGNAVSAYDAAIGTFQTISGWRDADEQINVCQRKIKEIKAKEEADRLECERKEEELRIAAEKAAKKRKITIAIVVPTIVACIAFVIVLTAYIIPNRNKDIDYNKAISLIESGKYVEAYEAFTRLNGYKDSDSKADEIRSSSRYYFELMVENATVGDYIMFGSYEQDNIISNGKEDIEWLVLAKEENRILVISRYALDCKQYNTSYTSITWETCSLRTWLNGTFVNGAFSSDEQKMILTTTVTADRNPSYNISPGSNTNDRVFLLSIQEVNKYFTTNDERKCVPTAYAKAQGAIASNSEKVDGKYTCYWWLRSPGSYSNFAEDVLDTGSVSSSGINVNTLRDCARPALWLGLDS